MTTNNKGHDAGHVVTLTPADTRVYTVTEINVAGKQLAMWLYNHCNVSLADTEIAFTRHPEWRGA